MLYFNHIDACAVFRKSTWKKVNGYAEDMPYMGNEDWNFWLKCIDNDCSFIFLDKICFQYRVLSTSMIRSIPEDYTQKNLAYNIEKLYPLYIKSFRAQTDKLHNILQGGLLKKIAKLILNHFDKYEY